MLKYNSINVTYPTYSYIHLLKNRYEFENTSELINMALSRYQEPNEPPVSSTSPLPKNDKYCVNVFKSDLEWLKQLKSRHKFKNMAEAVTHVLEQLPLPPAREPKLIEQDLSPAKVTKVRKAKLANSPGELIFNNILAYLDRQRKAKNKARREARET
jgi:hypothetical protein